MAATILIVEDVVEIRLFMSKVLKKTGFPCLEADTGEKAVHLIQQNKEIKLIFLDIILPDVDGYQVLTRVKPLKVERGFKVCFVSGKNDKEAILKAIESGGDDYLVKPLYTESLLAKVGALLGKNDLLETYNSIKCSIPCQLAASPILPDLHVIELTETTVVLRSTAAIKEGCSIEIDSNELRYYLKHEGTFTLKVTTCRRAGVGRYSLECLFLGLTETMCKEIRALTIRGKLLT